MTFALVISSFEWCFSLFFFFKQKTAYEMRISDWSSDVCSSDLPIGADLGIEDLRHAFLGHVVERLAQLLGLGRVFQHHAAQDFGREIGQSGDRKSVV